MLERTEDVNEVARMMLSDEHSKAFNDFRSSLI